MVIYTDVHEIGIFNKYKVFLKLYTFIGLYIDLYFSLLIKKIVNKK